MHYRYIWCTVHHASGSGWWFRLKPNLNNNSDGIQRGGLQLLNSSTVSTNCLARRFWCLDGYHIIATQAPLKVDFNVSGEFWMPLAAAAAAAPEKTSVALEAADRRPQKAPRGTFSCLCFLHVCCCRCSSVRNWLRAASCCSAACGSGAGVSGPGAATAGCSVCPQTSCVAVKAPSEEAKTAASEAMACKGCCCCCW